MWKRKAVFAAVIVSVAAGLFMAQAFSQQAPGERPGRAGGAAGTRRTPEEMRQAYLDRIKTTLGVTDEEWAALVPKIEKVQGLSSQLTATGRMGAGGRRQPAGAAPAELTEIEKLVQNLRGILENQQATADEITNGLKALREAREKVKQELTKAQEDLRQTLTARQEAQLVLMGLLD